MNYTGDGEVGNEDCENIGDFQIITEIWVEPQCGNVQIPSQQKAEYMHCLQYHQLPDAVSKFPFRPINFRMISTSGIYISLEIVHNYYELCKILKTTKKYIFSLKLNFSFIITRVIFQI